MIAPENPPDAEPTITASEVAMNKALPSPHPARKPMIWLIVCDDPASALKTTMRVSPAISVRLPPDPTGDPAGDEHGDRRDHEIAREKQLDRTRSCMQLPGQRWQDWVHQANSHERDDAGQGDRPHGLRLPERAGRLDGSSPWPPQLPARRSGRRLPLLAVEFPEMLQSGDGRE